MWAMASTSTIATLGSIPTIGSTIAILRLIQRERRRALRYANGTQSVNLFDLATRNGQTSTPDPVIGKLLADIRAATATTGGIANLTDPNLQRYSYSPTGSSSNKKPTVRFDVSASASHQISATWSYLDGRGGPDFLNNVEPRFPASPTRDNSRRTAIPAHSPYVRL
jgi:hypothetical protein